LSESLLIYFILLGKDTVLMLIDLIGLQQSYTIYAAFLRILLHPRKYYSIA